jgi:putative flippase GtrA
MAQQSSAAPIRKVWVGAVAGAATTIAVWALSLAKVDVPAVVASAITTLLTFIISYIVSPADTDQVS